MPRLRLLALAFTLLLVAPAALPPAVAEGEAHPVFVPLLQTDLPPSAFFATPEGVLVAVPSKEGGILYRVSAEGAVRLEHAIGRTLALTADGALITERGSLMVYQGENLSTNLTSFPWYQLAFGPEGNLYGIASGYPEGVHSLSEEREVRFFGRAQGFAFSQNALHLRDFGAVTSLDPATGETLAKTRLHSGYGGLLAFDAEGRGYFDNRTSAGTEIRRFTPGIDGSELVLRADGHSIHQMAFAGSDLVVARCVQWTCDVGYYPAIAKGFVGHQSSFRPIPVGDLVVSDLQMRGGTLTVEVSNTGEHATLSGSMLRVERHIRQPMGIVPRPSDPTLVSATLPALAPGEKIRLSVHADNMTDGMVRAMISTSSYWGNALEEENLSNNHRELRTRGLIPTGADALRS